MSSLTTPEPTAVRLENVSKIYRLHGSQRDQLIDVLGLNRLGFNARTPAKEFSALSNLSINVPKGHRIGIVGRNGAGKTTLLKLICGNFAPTRGQVEVSGSVQALMGVGLGFHPEYTGRENVEASLQYNGLDRSEYLRSMESIIEFCELGDFLDQPFKTYSLGMQARLMFAAATAIEPDILIVDEILGAGDAYFIAKSKARVEKLVSSGCTMLLVSHSMDQVLELCEEVIWLDQGRIRMRGDSFLVVKAYEEYLHGPISKISVPKVQSNGGTEEVHKISEESGVVPISKLDLPPVSRFIKTTNEVLFQQPSFIPHAFEVDVPGDKNNEFHFVAPGGISRWDSEPGLKVVGFSIHTEKGFTNTLIAMRPAKFVLGLVAELDGEFNCCYGVALHDHLGACVTRIFSPRDKFEINQGELRTVEVLLNPCQVGPGEYSVGVSVADYADIEKINEARRFDLLSRSFIVNVELPGSLSAVNASFFHSAEWFFGK